MLITLVIEPRDVVDWCGPELGVHTYVGNA